MSLKPSVMQMLQIGKGMGFDTVSEAFDSYMMHYDCFFLIDKFAEQNKAFEDRLKELGFVEQINGKFYIKDMTIDEGLEILKNEQKTNDSR